MDDSRAAISRAGMEIRGAESMPCNWRWPKRSIWRRRALIDSAPTALPLSGPSSASCSRPRWTSSTAAGSEAFMAQGPLVHNYRGFRMNRKLILAIASLSALAAPLAFGADSFGDRARVLSSRPIYDRIPVSREECWNDRQRVYEDRRVTRSDTG